MTTAQKENLLIIGSTGWIGTYITQEIIAAKHHFNRIVIFTSPSTLEKKAELFEAYKKEGVEIIAGDVEKEVGIERALNGFQYTYLVTGPYAGGYLSKSLGDMVTGGFDVEGKKAVALGDGKGRVSLTTERDVGRLLVASLLHPTESRNRALCVNSFTTTPLDIVAEFEKQTGGQKWDVSYTSFETLKKLEKEAWDGGKNGTGFSLRRIWGEGGTLYEKRDNWRIGMEDDKIETLGDAVGLAIRGQVGNNGGEL